MRHGARQRGGRRAGPAGGARLDGRPGRFALHSQLQSALDLVIHLARDPRTGRRRVAEVHTLDRGSTGLTVTAPAVIFGPDNSVACGPGWDRLLRLCNARGVPTSWGV